jgi:hypothetical protein
LLAALAQSRLHSRIRQLRVTRWTDTLGDCLIVLTNVSGPFFAAEEPGSPPAGTVGSGERSSLPASKPRLQPLIMLSTFDKRVMRRRRGYRMKVSRRCLDNRVTELALSDLGGSQKRSALG